MNILSRSNNNLSRFINIANSDADFNDSDLSVSLADLNKKLNIELQNGIYYIIESFNKKRENLSHFTITLFGRTKAGKSTIREALTHGDGSSIGKGDQRTTRDIHEYMWNNLRIIDTPGISAYQGEEDVKIAESVIDESDLILFLVTSDSIQESEFNKLVELKTQNKPIIVILNVKMDIEQRIRLKKFISTYHEIISLEGQKGHIERIRDLAQQYLGYDDIEIFPIHALSAFKSTQESDEELKRMLYNASRINTIKIMLRQLIINQGIQKRTLTFRDDYIFYIASLENVFWEFYKRIKPRIRYLKSKQVQINNWFQDYKDRGNNYIGSKVEEIFAPLYSEIPVFVDKYAGKASAENEWNTIISRMAIEAKCQEISNDLVDEVKRYLEEFSRQLKFEIHNINFDNEMADLGNLKKGVIGKVARWGGATLGGLEGALLIGIGLNWWNPAGWVMGVIAAGGLLAGLFSLFYGDDSKRYEKEKAKMKKSIHSTIKLKEEQIIKQLTRWFNKNVLHEMRFKIQIELRNSLNQMEKYTDIIQESATLLENISREENKDLFTEIFFQTFGLDISGQVIGVAREQGKLLKVLINGHNPILASIKERKRLEKIIGERIIYVEFISDPIELFKRAIFPGKIDNADIRYDANERVFEVKAPRDIIGSIIGRHGTNIKMTSRLLDVMVNVEGV